MATKKDGPDVEALVKQALEYANRSTPSEPPKLDDLQAHMPMLHAFMTCTRLNGKVRTLPTITLWAEEGSGAKCVLNDRQAKVKLFARSDSVWGLLEALEAALTSPSVDWRGDNGAPKKRRS